MKYDNIIVKICPDRSSLQTITNTEKIMNVTFSEDYKQFTLEYGFIALSSPFINFYEWQFLGALNNSEYDRMNIFIFNDDFRKNYKNSLMNNDEYVIAVHNIHNGFVPYVSNAKGEIFKLDTNSKILVAKNIGVFYNKICKALSQKYNKVTHSNSKYYSWDERDLFLDTIIVRPRKSVNNIHSLTDRNNVRSIIAKFAIADNNFDSYEDDRIRFYYDNQSNKFNCISIAYPTFVILKPNDLLLDKNFNKLIKQLKSLDKDFINQNDGRRNIYYFKNLNIQVVNTNNSENYSTMQVYVA